jgi:probable F420-dependent oxidoreductase
MELGRVGVWNGGFRSEKPGAREEIKAAATELDQLGYGSIWLGLSPQVHDAEPILKATTGLTVATGIVNIWADDAAIVAAEHARLTAAHPGRFLLGLGASHSVLVKEYHKPYSAMVAFLDGLDAAVQPVPKNERVLAALGPKMLTLAGRRARGAHPYLVTPEHTATARERLDDGSLLAPEIKVVLESDPGLARIQAREHLAVYLQMINYTGNLLRLGFTEDDLADGGSDRLIDATFAWGGDDAVRARVAEFEDAGADHVVLNVIGGPAALPRQAWRDLAETLKLTPRP